jgi:hypothetical protein
LIDAFAFGMVTPTIGPPPPKVWLELLLLELEPKGEELDVGEENGDEDDDEEENELVDVVEFAGVGVLDVLEDGEELESVELLDDESEFELESEPVELVGAYMEPPLLDMEAALVAPVSAVLEAARGWPKKPRGGT